VAAKTSPALRDELDEIAELLGRELAALVDAAEATLAELEAIEALRGEALAEGVRHARDTRRSAMRTRNEAVELAARSHDTCARARALVETCAARVDAARSLMR